MHTLRWKSALASQPASTRNRIKARTDARFPSDVLWSGCLSPRRQHASPTADSRRCQCR
jgi:hypothetical protein